MHILCVCVFVCACQCVWMCICLMHMHMFIPVAPNPPPAIRRCQPFGECTDLSEYHPFWEWEHLTGIAVFYLAFRTAALTVATIIKNHTDDSGLASLNGLTEDRIQAGGKYFHNKLERFAVWTVASFYNNFHLKLPQYIFNEFFCKTFNSPQFKWQMTQQFEMMS